MALETFSDFTMNLSVRTLLCNGAAYFCGKDVASALGYTNPQKAIRDHVFEEDRSKLEDFRVNATFPHSKSEQGQSVYITEPGVYALVFGSKLESARTFKRWVCSEILPRLRKNLQAQQSAPLCLRNESDLHYKVVDFIRRFFPHALLSAGLGELQDTSSKRMDAWKKGYQSGTPDILIHNYHARYNGFAIELKNPRGTGRHSEKQFDCLAQFQTAKFQTLVSDDYDRIILEIVNYFANVRLCCPHCKKRFKTQETLENHLRCFHRLANH